MKIALLALLLAGCAASGVTMSDEEAAECRRVGCTVWTQEELTGLAQQFFYQGVQRGLQGRSKGL